MKTQHSLLDSSLITEYNFEKKRVYNKKVIVCGDYVQVYHHYQKKLKNDEQWEKQKINKKNIDIDNLYKKENINKKDDFKVIEYKNIMRSKFQLQRLVKSNEKVFTTFITLTFSDNIIDLKYANKCFHNWRNNIKKKKKDFLYICVPEFQKRGAVHYHLLTNLDIRENPDLIIPQKDKKSMYDVKYWSHGFTSVFPMKNINIVGYITKYMTKDIDNRLFGHRRYLASRDLIKPKVMYINDDNLRDDAYLQKIMKNTELKFNNIYLDYFNDVIVFSEYKKKN